MEMTTPLPPGVQSSANQLLQTLQQGFKQGATPMGGDLMGQWQQAAQVPAWMGGVGDVFGQGYQAPAAWGQAQDIFGQLAGYQPTQPQAWGTAQQGLTGMAATGMPTTAMPWYQQGQKIVGTQVGQAGKELAEQFGLGGMRTSTGLGQQLGQIATQAQERLGQQYLGMEMAGQEAARARQMGAYSGLTGLGQAQAGLDMFGRQIQMGAGQGLAGLGGMQAQAPLSWAQAATGAAGAQQQMGLQAMQPQLQEFYRTMPEANPWMQPWMQHVGGMGGYMQQIPQQYQPSPFSQIMQGVGSGMDYYQMMKMMGGG